MNYRAVNECLISMKMKLQTLEKKRDKYIRILNAYIDGRTGRKESEINEKKRELEPLIKKLEEDILSIENSYCEDIKKKIEDYYKNYKM